MFHILIIDDQEDIRRLMADILEDEGYKVSCAYNVQSALTKLQETKPHVVILDIWLEGNHMDGIGLLKKIQKQYGDIPIVMISGHANAEIGAMTIKLGAYDFLEKPFKSEKLLLTIKRAIQTTFLSEANKSLRHKLLGDDRLIGVSRSISEVRKNLPTMAANDSRIFIHGPIGSGKGRIALGIHNLSTRSSRNFVTISPNEWSLKKNMSVIFGINDGEEVGQPSLLEQADHGTLFIDEVAMLHPRVQEELLKVIQGKKLVRPGEDDIHLDIRFIAASSITPEEAIAERKLNANLYARLNVNNIHIPPIKDRKEDLLPIIKHFLEQMSAGLGFNSDIEIDSETLSMLRAYEWPLNIREIRNVVEHMLILAHRHGSNRLEARFLPMHLLQGANYAYTDLESAAPKYLGKKYREAKRMFDSLYLQAQLKVNGSISKTAVEIGMDRAALHRKMKLLNIRDSDEDNESKEK